MKLILHIVRKDFLRLRGWLAVWGLVLATKVAVGFVARSSNFGDANPDWSQLTEAVAFLNWCNGVMTFLLALLLVQEDALVGTRQFWITRPISGGRLLGGKCLGIVLMLGGLPGLVALPWWLSCGLGPRELAWVVTETIGLQVAIALPASLVASLTDSLQRSVLWTFVLVVALASGTAWWGFFVANRLGNRNIELAWSRTWIPVATLAATAASAILLQFVARRLARSLVVLGGGIALAVTIAGWWPEAWSSKFQMTEVNAGRATGVTLEFVRAMSLEMNRKMRDVRLNVDLRARGAPADCWLTGIDGGMQTLWWPGGPELVRDGWAGGNYRDGEWGAARAALGLRDPKTDPETERTLQESWQRWRESSRAERERLGFGPLPVYRPDLPPPKSDTVELSTGIMAPRSLVARMRAEPPAYDGHISMQLLRPEVWFETPLLAGNWQSRAAHRLWVARAERMIEGRPKGRLSDKVRVVVAETLPSTWQADWRAVYFPADHDSRQLGLQQQAIFYALNRSLGQMEELTVRDQKRLRVCSVEIVWSTMMATVSKISRNGAWVDWQPSWPEGATLALVGFREEARFSREVKVDRFEIAK